MNHIINLLNKYNINLQSQKASISQIKRNIHQCYYSILELVLKPLMSDNNIDYYLEQDWEDWNTHDKFFFSPSEFISNIVSIISSKFQAFEKESKEVQNTFASIFFDFIGKLLNLLKDYLPYQDKLVQILDFVELKESMPIFKQKLKRFCDFFKLIKEEEKSQLQEEFVKLKDIRIDYYQDSSKSLLHMWDRIQSNENLNLIPKIVFFAEALPTTSAGLEQSFSQIKLLKTDLRNRLEESTLEGLALISQEFSEAKSVQIDDKMVKLFLEVKKNFNKAKKVKKNSSIKKNDSNETNEFPFEKEADSKPTDENTKTQGVLLEKADGEGIIINEEKKRLRVL